MKSNQLASTMNSLFTALLRRGSLVIGITAMALSGSVSAQTQPVTESSSATLLESALSFSACPEGQVMVPVDSPEAQSAAPEALRPNDDFVCVG
jgi:hypothetical protein